MLKVEEEALENVSVWEGMIQSNLHYVTNLPAALLTLVAAYIIIRIVRQLVATTTTIARVDKTVQSLIMSMISFAGWILAIATALSVMGLNQISLALAGSIALIAMALASGMNNVTQDLLAGVFLTADRDLRVGRRIKAGGVEGTLLSLTIRKTRVQDDSGHIHTIPNRSVDGSTYIIINESDEGEKEEKGA